MFAFFTPKHLLTCSILGSCEHCFEGEAEVTAGYQPYAVRCHHGISGCCWFKANEGNTRRRCFLLQGCLNFPGKSCLLKDSLEHPLSPLGHDPFLWVMARFHIQRQCLVTGESHNVNVCSFVGGFGFGFFCSTTLIQSAHCHQCWEVSVLFSVGYIDEVSDAFTLSITSISSCPSFSEIKKNVDLLKWLEGQEVVYGNFFGAECS